MALEKKSYSEQIYEQLKEDILCNRIPFGAVLANRELQKRFGVSSTPVRDAINHLNLEGFIDEINQGGARVVNFDLTSALEINEIVSLLSVRAVELAAERADRQALSSQLKQAIDLQKLHQDGDGYYEQDNQFHLTFFRYAQNSRLLKLYRQYDLLQEILIRYYYQTGGRDRVAAIAEHQRIYFAMQAGDTVEAARQMALHYQGAQEKLRQVLK